ncbi:ATP-dependent protease [Altericroceibacterium spongiae]|uniref:ATP-dependent protease n=1 Tax=Altericroceibacterium spongiae TaxID=2320269 RepID=A0A420EPK6_9SPHN|nr:LON peptidase substrate-binding domain-containing protein [Altericroceibacterium spongiae]RKF22600.1 ATP-dependent protease [Altericroceibacterium spongiae]
MNTARLSIFPLSGVVMFPGLQLPLHIFEPRYRALVGDALARDRKIAMIQPRAPGERAELFSIGCIGRIDDVEALEDGRYNIVLEGVTRFRLIRELTVSTAFRQVEGELIEEPADEALSSIERASIEREAQNFAERQGYSVDWESVSQLDDVALVNGISQIAPFDAAAKQALLEAPDLRSRCELLVQLMQFFARGNPDEGRATLQ